MGPEITSLEEKTQSGLAPATEDRPQVVLNSKDAANDSSCEERRFTVEGLVRLHDPQSERRLFADRHQSSGRSVGGCQDFIFQTDDFHSAFA
jgi:hypothetical protein